METVGQSLGHSCSHKMSNDWKGFVPSGKFNDDYIHGIYTVEFNKYHHHPEEDASLVGIHAVRQTGERDSASFYFHLVLCTYGRIALYLQTVWDMSSRLKHV